MGTKKNSSSIGIGLGVGVGLETHVVDATASQINEQQIDTGTNAEEARKASKENKEVANEERVQD